MTDVTCSPVTLSGILGGSGALGFAKIIPEGEPRLCAAPDCVLLIVNTIFPGENRVTAKQILLV